MKKLLLSILPVLLAYSACERPNDPDFKLEQKVYAPILFNKTFQFLGGSEALIDTTNTDFDSLFTTDGNGVVSLAMTEDFEVDDLDEAIPEMNVDPISANAAVGELSLQDFSSQGDNGNLGEADYQDLTGGSAPAPGTPVPGGSTPADFNIDINTDYFVSATVKGSGGSLGFDIQNDLGLDLDDIAIDFYSGTDLISTDNTGMVLNGEEVSVILPIADGVVLQDLNMDVSVSWSAQNTQAAGNILVVEQVTGTDLVASQVEAALESQEFTSTGSIAVDSSSFEFNDLSHYIEIESGMLVIDQIINQIDLKLDTLVISFPDIRSAPFNPEDSMVVRFEGTDAIQRSTSGLPQPTQNIDLSGLRIVGPDNNLDYNIRGVTEQTQGTADEVRTISENDGFSADVSISNLMIHSAFGIIQEKEFLISSDDIGNGLSVLDLFNDVEAEVITIDALQGLSDNGGISFDDPILSIAYESNLGVDTDVIGVIAGVDEDGNEVYLTGNSGTPYEVTAGDLPSASFRSNGLALDISDMIKLPVAAVSGGMVESGSFVFNSSNSNADDFLNNLPSEIRVIGVSRISEGSVEGTVTSPVVFDPEFSLDVPLDFSADDAGYSDTTEVDLGDLPNPAEDEQRLTEASIHIRYDNLLPFQLEVSMVMLDSTNAELTRIPLSGQESPILNGAPVDANGFVTGSAVGTLVFNLNSSQLDVLYLTRAMRVSVTFNTTDNQAVKVKANDSITLNLSLRAAVETTVD